MKVLIVGGVAAGTKVAAKLKREDRSCEVTILTKGKDISYAGCGLPYYVGKLIPDRSELIVNTPESFAGLTGVTVKTEIEVTKVNPDEKTIDAVDLKTGQTDTYEYDKLVIATGADSIRPPIEGVNLENVFLMRTPDDAVALRDAVEAGNIKRAVVVGGGFIGLEVAENLAVQGVRVTLVDMVDQIMPGFEKELADYAANHMMEEGIMIFTGTPLEAILGESKVEKVTAGGRTFKTDAVVLSVGVRPNTAFLEDSGIEMVRRTIKVNEYMETNIEDIYAVGDCAMVTNALTKAPAWSPMGSTANITGRICAKNIAGKGPKAAYKGVLGTAVVKLPGLNGARTGLTEAGAADAGFDPVSVCTVVDDKAHYYPDASFFIVKMIADRNTKKLLGLQVLGAGAVDKMVDIAAMGMYMDATIDDLADMDLAYAPPFSTAIHPLVHTVNVLLNKMSGEFKTMTPAEYANGAAEGYRIIDASINPAIEGVTYVDLATVEGEVPGLAKDEKLLLVCTKGKRGYMLQNRLKYYGYTNTLVLEGGDTLNEIEV